MQTLQSVDLAEVTICASVVVSQPTEGFSVSSTDPDSPNAAFEYGGAFIAGFVSPNHKCGRCWRHLPEVADDGALCGRCEDVVGG